MQPRFWTTFFLTSTIALSGCSKATSPAVGATKTTSASAAALSIEGGVDSDFAKTLSANMLAAGTKYKVKSVLKTSSPVLYWVSFEGMPSVYVTADGKFLLQGDVLQLEQGKITDMKGTFLNAEATKLLAQVPVSDSIVFAPTAPVVTKKTIYVFTDVDCGYCRKLHSEIHEINAKGIEVHYLAWPRSEASVPAMQSVWCSQDRQAALTAAKNGIPIAPATCQNPVMQQRELGMSLGVQGTPTVFSEDGKQLGGYLPADELAKKLGL